MSVTNDDEIPIARLEGAPANPTAPGEPGLWQRFKRFVGRAWGRAEGVGERAFDLGERAARAKVAQESNTAAKIGAEAATLAAKLDVEPELIRAQTEKTDAESQKLKAETRLTSAQAQAQEFKNIDEACKDRPDLATMLKLAHISKADPRLVEQFDRVQYMLDDLRLRKGVTLEIEATNLGDSTTALAGSEPKALPGPGAEGPAEDEEAAS